MSKYEEDKSEQKWTRVKHQWKRIEEEHEQNMSEHRYKCDSKKFLPVNADHIKNVD